MKRLLYYLVLLSSLVSFVITVIYGGNIAGEFCLVMLYPLLYGFFFLLLWPIVSRKASNGRITVSVFLILQWLRLVLLPGLGAISGYFTISGGLINESSAQTACLLVIYESIVTFLVAFLILRRKGRTTQLQPEQKKWDGLSGNRWIYILFVLVAAMLFALDGADRYTFFALDVGEEGRVSVSQENSEIATGAIIDYGLSILVILLAYFCFEKYKKTGRKRYMYTSLLVALARICIIDAGSDGRLAVLYSIGAFLLLLPNLYKAHKKIIIRSIVLTGVAVLALMTVYKVFQAFFYDSYFEAIQNNVETFDTYDTAQQIDIYFYGVRTIARNLYVSKRVNLDFTTLLTDYLQNTFGVHYLFGDSLNTTIAKYNLYIYNGEYASGHLYSSLAHGASYLTVVLAPLMTVVNMLICASLEKWLQRLRHIDSYYIISVVYIRFVYNIFACFPMAWNYASRTLVLGALVIGGASLFKIRAKTGNIPENRLKEAK